METASMDEPTTFNEEPDIKVYIVGDGAVGKNSLFTALIRDELPFEYTPTIQATYKLALNVGREVVLVEFKVVGGQEDFIGFRKLFLYDNYNASNNIPKAFWVLFSCRSVISSNNIRGKWFPEIKRFVNDSHPNLFLLGTHSDVGYKYIPNEAIENISEALSASWAICSAKEYVEKGKDQGNMTKAILTGLYPLVTELGFRLSLDTFLQITKFSFPFPIDTEFIKVYGNPQLREVIHRERTSHFKSPNTPDVRIILVGDENVNITPFMVALLTKRKWKRSPTNEIEWYQFAVQTPIATLKVEILVPTGSLKTRQKVYDLYYEVPTMFWLAYDCTDAQAGKHISTFWKREIRRAVKKADFVTLGLKTKGKEDAFKHTTIRGAKANVRCCIESYVNKGQTDEENGKVEEAVKLGLYKMANMGMSKKDFMSNAKIDVTEYTTSHKHLTHQLEATDHDEIYHEWYMI